MEPLYHAAQQPSDIPSAPGIYKITHSTTGKFYIGSTADLRKRWRQHRSELRRNKHCNQKMQYAWNKYGPDAFIFETIETRLAPVSART